MARISLQNEGTASRMGPAFRWRREQRVRRSRPGAWRQPEADRSLQDVLAIDRCSRDSISGPSVRQDGKAGAATPAPTTSDQVSHARDPGQLAYRSPAVDRTGRAGFGLRRDHRRLPGLSGSSHRAVHRPRAHRVARPRRAVGPGRPGGHLLPGDGTGGALPAELGQVRRGAVDQGPVGGHSRAGGRPTQAPDLGFAGGGPGGHRGSHVRRDPVSAGLRSPARTQRLPASVRPRRGLRLLRASPELWWTNSCLCCFYVVVVAV